MSDEAPKSAYEIAMERLRRKDAEEGTAERPLTEAQKKAIAEARRVCEAKLAELQILHQSKLSGIYDPEARKALEDTYRIDVQRATAERDRQIAKIRRAP